MLIIAHAPMSGSEVAVRAANHTTDEDYRWADRYTAPRRRAQSLAARALLRSVLEQGTGIPGAAWRLFAHADGRPGAECGNGRTAIEVSLSHSHDLVACAVTDCGPVGIDVEHCAVRANFAALAAADFGRREAQAAAQGGPSAFYRIWTLREALAKASGTGFPLTHADRDLFFDVPLEGRWNAHVDEREWSFTHCFLPAGYSLAVAVATDPRRRV